MAWRKAREGKISHADVINFEKNTELNLLNLHYELSMKSYAPYPLRTFVLRDPKTRLISKSDFRDRIVHHALINIIKEDLSKRLIEAKGMRNYLAHQYGEIDDEQVFEAISNELGKDMRTFLQCIENI